MKINRKWLAWGAGVLLAGIAAILSQCTGVSVPPPNIPPPPDEPIFATGRIEDTDATKAFCETLEFQRYYDTPAGKAVQGDEPDRVVLSDAQPKTIGSLLPSYDQGQVGSCVSFGTVMAIQTSWIVEISTDPQRKGEFKELAQEAIYALSRVEIGQRRIRGDGSVGAWAAQAVTDGKYGCLARGVYGRHDVTRYDERRCREWGDRGLPDELEPLAKKHPCRTITQILSAAEMRKALRNGHSAAICSRLGFGPQRDADGFCRQDRDWGHCTAIVGYIKFPNRTGYVCWNSWGEKYHRGPLPAGISNACFLIEERDLERMLQERDTWAFSGPSGFKANPVDKLDWFIRAVRPEPRVEIAAAGFIPPDEPFDWAIFGAAFCLGGLAGCGVLLFLAPRKGGKWLLIICVMAVASTANADDLAKAKARAAIALALAEQESKPMTPWTELKDAYNQAIKERRVVVVHVNGFDCGNVCTVDERVIRTKCETVFDDNTPRMILFAPTADNRVEFVREWKSKPTSEEVKKEVQQATERIPTPKAPTPNTLEWSIRRAPATPTYYQPTPSYSYAAQQPSYQTFSNYGYSSRGAVCST